MKEIEKGKFQSDSKQERITYPDFGDWGTDAGTFIDGGAVNVTLKRWQVVVDVDDVESDVAVALKAGVNCTLS